MLIYHCDMFYTLQVIHVHLWPVRKSFCILRLYLKLFDGEKYYVKSISDEMKIISKLFNIEKRNLRSKIQWYEIVARPSLSVYMNDYRDRDLATEEENNTCLASAWRRVGLRAWKAGCRHVVIDQVKSTKWVASLRNFVTPLPPSATCSPSLTLYSQSSFQTRNFPLCSK